MRSMEQMYAMALDPRIFPDQRLLAIMQGRDQSLPMAIAMAAKQQRDKRRTAEQGKAAQAEAKQPTVKDKMLARDLPPEETGLAMLPAENMAGMDDTVHAAGGGIIAFADEGLVPDDTAPMTTKQMNDLLYGRGIARTPEQIEKAKQESANFFMSPRTRAARATATPTAGPDVDTQAGGFYGGAAPTPQQFLAAHPNITNASVGTATAAPAVKQTGVGTPPAQGGAAAAAAQNLGIGEPPKRVDRFAGLGETQEAFDKKIAEEKKMGQADFLMTMGLKMMGVVGPLGKATSEGGLAGLPSLGASRKTIRELQKGRQDYEFNMAKAQSALDQGDQELALGYKKLAEQAAYHTGLLAVEKTKAGAYAASVGSKEDIANQKREASIMGIAKGLLEKNMKYNLPGTSAAERQSMEQAAINSAVNMYNSATAATGSAGGFKYLGKET